MYEYSLIEIICSKLNIQSNIKYFTIVDELIFELNTEKINKILEDYKINNNPTPIEKYVIDINLDKCAKYQDRLSSNYYNNSLLNLYLILGNPSSIDSLHFESIYYNQKIFKLIVDDIKSDYNKILLDPILYKFYNIDIINKWQKTIIPKKLSKRDYYSVSKLNNTEKDNKWNKYEFTWNKYNEACLELQKYLYKVEHFYKNKKIDVVGCYNIGNNMYQYCLETHLGIKIDIKKLKAWAEKELKRLVINIKNTLKLIDPTIDMTKSHIKIIKEIGKSQKYKSKEEYVNNHLQIIKKYERIFIKEFGFKDYSHVNLIVFDNKYLAGGYYFNENFYLNSVNWKESNKYLTESLVLHETLPGHYLQLHPVKYTNQDNNLLFSYFKIIINGFAEGWGLFSEKLGVDQTLWDKVGQFEYEIFRTIRVIADISIHYEGAKPFEMINFMKKYLAFGDNEINSEIYRYVCNPGQAVSYKIGSHIFETIIKNKGIKNLMDPEALEIYKKIIADGHMPLKFLLEKYNISESDLFL